jgi:uncharacterized protein with FMN-binding domain
MRKGIVAILAVAIIGALGVAAKSQSKDTSQKSAQPTTSVQSETTNSSHTAVGSNDASSSSTSTFKDGTYTGDNESTPYGDVQIAVVISGGKITGVNFLQMPDDRGHTQEVTAFSQPLLQQETLRKQSAKIDFVSGATQTSEGYQRSLQSALNQAA